MIGISVMTHFTEFRDGSLLVSVNYLAGSMATALVKQNGGMLRFTTE